MLVSTLLRWFQNHKLLIQVQFDIHTEFRNKPAFTDVDTRGRLQDERATEVHMIEVSGITVLFSPVCHLDMDPGLFITPHSMKLTFRSPSPPNMQEVSKFELKLVLKLGRDWGSSMIGDNPTSKDALGRGGNG